MPKSPSILLARFFSLVLHPVFIPLLFGLVAYPINAEWARYHLLVALFLVAIPGILSLVWLYLQKENNLFVVEQSNRIVPLLAIIIGIAFLGVGSGAFLPDNQFPGVLLLNVFVMVFFSLSITFYWKISLHGMGWGSATALAGIGYYLGPEALAEFGLIGFPTGLVLGICLAASVLIFPARLLLKAHTPAQLIVGWLFGFVMMLAITFVAVLM